jgi:addiction module RelB/DinJ family antitoxin
MTTKTKAPAKTTKNLVVPLDANLKSQVKDILDQLGLNQSQIVVALFKEIARTKRIPLSFDLNDPRVRQATPQEARAIEEAWSSGIATPQEVAEIEQELGIKLAY